MTHHVSHGRHRHRRSIVIAGALAAMLTLVSACGGGDETAAGSGAPPEAGAPEVTELTVGVLPIADLAPFYLAISEGFFADEGLDVTAETASGGASQLASMVAGNLDLAYTNYVSAIQAAAQGLPIRIIRENNRSGPQGIYAAPGSGIESPEDLAGKRIAINSLNNVQQLTAEAVLDSHGVDPDSLQFLELPPPEQPAALEKGAVDAAWLVDPFVTQVEQSGAGTRIVSAFEGPTEDFPVAGWTATAEYVQQNPNTVAAFDRALDRAFQLVDEQPEKIAETVPTYTKISPELAGQLATPGLAVHSDLSDLGTVADLMVTYGIIDEAPDMSRVVVGPDELPAG